MVHCEKPGSHGGKFIDLTCTFCRKNYQRRTCQVSASQKLFFCSRPCKYAWRSANGKEWGKNHSYMNTPEAQAKAKASMELVRSSPDYVHPWTGRSHSEETRKKIKKSHELSPRSGESNGMFGRKHKAESREKISETRTSRMISGEIKAGYTRHERGSYTDKIGRVYNYKSSWEHALMKWLDFHRDIVSWDYESLKISYYDTDNHRRYYIPDFTVEFSDGTKKMYEIKPKQFLTTEAHLRKTEAAKKYCSENEFDNFEVLTKDELRAMGALS